VNELEHIFFSNRQVFRDWLEQNHSLSTGIWMVYNKSHVAKKGITYREALEEALCFGWIDSLIKRIDQNQYMRKFTPRTNTGQWSDLNKQLVAMLIENGRMTEAGLKMIDSKLLKKTKSVDPIVEPGKTNKAMPYTIPKNFLAVMSQSQPALENFNRLAPSHQRHYILWITNAKRPETIQKRIEEAVTLLKKNQKLGLK
jgi:uncharacterized protein YdeI (YjbR/CyaY-like superfamily)